MSRKNGKVSINTVYAVTSLSAEQTTPAQLTNMIRSHWQIEAPHHVRDTPFAEDVSQLRTGSAPPHHGDLAQPRHWRLTHRRHPHSSPLHSAPTPATRNTPARTVRPHVITNRTSSDYAEALSPSGLPMNPCPFSSDWTPCRR
ncbi:hypothetical protein GCM10009646_73640 [Streptomyces aureus]